MTTATEELIGIGDASRILDVAPHTLRYWEKEFDFFLEPVRTEGRQRRYDDESLHRLERVKVMLKDEGYSIAGAKKILQKEMRGEKVDLQKSPLAVRSEVLRRISNILENEMSDSFFATYY